MEGTMNTSKERDQGLRSRVRMYAPLMMAAAVILLSAAQGAAGASGGWYLMKAPQKSTLRDWLPAEVQSWLIYHYHIRRTVLRTTTGTRRCPSGPRRACTSRSQNARTRKRLGTP